MKRAQAAYDLLAAHPRVDTAVLALWLLGFRMELDTIRAVYGRLIGRHFDSIGGRSGRPLDEAIGKLAEMFARQRAKTSAAPTHVQQAINHLTYEFLQVFYGVNEEFAGDGLAALWEKAAPYLGSDASRPIGWPDFSPQDDDLEAWARHLREMVSLKAQLKAVTSATDYELIRARRLVLLVFGYLDRLARAADRGTEFEEFGRMLHIVLGRPAVPILIMVLRRDELRYKIVSSLLNFAKMLPPSPKRLISPGPGSGNHSRTYPRTYH